MFLKSLRLHQFRNYVTLALDFEPALTLIHGRNGAGKTNLLEAVAVAATGMSFRGAEADHLIHWGQRSAQLRGVFEGRRLPIEVDMKLRLGKSRQVRVDGSALLRLRDLMWRVPLVSFDPEDLYFIKGEPDVRRRSLNAVLCQVNRPYLDALKAYQEALQQRNAALREMARQGL